MTFITYLLTQSRALRPSPPPSSARAWASAVAVGWACCACVPPSPPPARGRVGLRPGPLGTLRCASGGASPVLRALLPLTCTRPRGLFFLARASTVSPSLQHSKAINYIIIFLRTRDYQHCASRATGRARPVSTRHSARRARLLGGPCGCTGHVVSVYHRARAVAGAPATVRSRDLFTPFKRSAPFCIYESMLVRGNAYVRSLTRGGA